MKQSGKNAYHFFGNTAQFGGIPVDIKTLEGMLASEDEDVIVCRKGAGIAVETGAVGQADMVSSLRVYLSGKGEDHEIDSEQDHTTDCNDGFLVSTMCFYTFVVICEFRMLFRFDQAFATCTRTVLKYEPAREIRVDLILRLL